MSKPRFFCAELAPGLITLDARESRHALHSLRLRGGEEVILFDGRGRVAHGVLQPADRTGGPKRRHAGATRTPAARVTVERVLCEPPPARTLGLIVAGCKGPRLTWMVEKLTELGTTRIVLAEFERSIVRVGPTHAARLRRTAVEAAKQSGQVWLPEIQCGMTLAEALADVAAGVLLVAHPADDLPTLSSYLHAHDLDEQHTTGVVGPEGGLADAEIAVLNDAGGLLIRLAPTILRVETAAISLAANWAAR